MAGVGSMPVGSSSEMLSGITGAITDALSRMNGQGSGDIVIPVYLGGNLLDEVIVDGQQRMNLRSGSKALEQQIHLLELRKEHLQNLIDLALGIKAIGVKYMSFEAFDTRKIDEYAAQAKASWGTTDAYKEYEQKSAGRTEETQQKLNVEMINIFAEFGKVKDLSPECEEAVALARKLQDHITENYYTCTDKILLGLGAMYAGGGDLTTNIDKVGGEGTAVFACEAIKAMIAKK